MTYNQIYLPGSSDMYLTNEVSSSYLRIYEAKIMSYQKTAAIIKDPFNKVVLGSSLCKDRTFIAKTPVFIGVPWRQSEPIAQYNEGKSDFTLE